MNKMLQIAWREFAATVFTKGFLIGLLILPLLIGLLVVLTPALMKFRAPGVKGDVAVVDAGTGVLQRLRPQLDPKAFAERRRAFDERLNAAMPAAAKALTGGSDARIGEAMKQAAGETPEIGIRVIDAAALEDAKKLLTRRKDDPEGLLAILVVHPNAVRPDGAGTLGSYDFFVREKFDDRLASELREAVKTAIVDARLAARQLDADDIRALTRVAHVRAQVITARGARSNNEIAAKLLPMAFMFLLLLTVMTAGQQLMTSTIEEKSSRVVEVLLAAVSPMQLMAGKIVGQMAVALVMMLVLGGLLGLTLVSFSLVGLIDPWLLVYLAIFFVIAFATMAALMSAIGAAVNELREAQALLTPVMLVVMVPSMLWMPISNAPDSTWSVVLSLLPPVSPFAMMLRLASHTPPPMWQVALSIVLGILGMLAAIWFAGKVFRIGLLMHGKPPNFMTLLRWVRMA